MTGDGGAADVAVTNAQLGRRPLTSSDRGPSTEAGAPGLSTAVEDQYRDTDAVSSSPSSASNSLCFCQMSFQSASPCCFSTCPRFTPGRKRMTMTGTGRVCPRRCPPRWMSDEGGKLSGEGPWRRLTLSSRGSLFEMSLFRFASLVLTPVCECWSSTSSLPKTFPIISMTAILLYIT